jgi:hypothetical protein
MFVTRQASCTVALVLFAASPAWAQGGPKTLELAGPGLSDVTGPITAVAATLGPASTGNPPYGVRIDATSGGRRLT